MAEKFVEAISEESIEKIAGGFNVPKKKALEVFKKVGIPVLAIGAGVAAGTVLGIGGTLGAQAIEGEGNLGGEKIWGNIKEKFTKGGGNPGGNSSLAQEPQKDNM